MIGDGKGYFGKLAAAMLSLGMQLDPVRDAIAQARIRGGVVFLCGNGGSFAAASHWACDLHKVCAVRTYVLGGNIPTLTAWSNDSEYDYAWANEFDQMSRTESLLIALSCSGTSPNVARVLEKACRLHRVSILITGRVHAHTEPADITIRVPSDDYGIIEDCFGAIGHYLTKELKG